MFYVYLESGFAECVGFLQIESYIMCIYIVIIQLGVLWVRFYNSLADM